ncbi:dihydrofolate reductase [Microbacterium phage Eden]|uniref:Dihydrofolate reductase n=1 Tax=Microbacterium phage Eden TaxID=2250289 RepID=A0A345KWF0_9CAUD|nr:dihydrofolate reductase [Microbacterium phage Eden]AXH47352.1 dihydrofolate reductase [Microbacterium phage Eden]
MTIETPFTRAIWAEGSRLSDGALIMGADTPSGLPWPKNDADLKQFREDTRDHVLIMGSKTFDLLPAGMKRPSSTVERPIIILTHRVGHYVHQTRGLGQAVQPINPQGTTEHGVLLNHLQHWDEYAGRPVAIIGGRRVIEAFEPYYDQLIVTHHLASRYDGTVLAPSDALMDNFKTESSSLLDSGTRRVVYTRRIPKD